MAAVITDTFRRYIANILFDAVSDISDSNQFYVGIGKSDLYNDSDIVIDPVRSLREERLARANLQSIKKSIFCFDGCASWKLDTGHNIF